ncbi:MAG: pyruvate synthase [Candidatus Dadabacteria bacterium]|nr:pyruvate synthase [Candidatus Dadabacteria bacterium]NIS09394.1 pyruvate synthase [Candidatus Dadabacteria bacterium]NIY22634.1 pyruvate synthase [Candidatus Dadabacteria bacterium]
MCAGCGGLQALHTIYDVLGEKTVFVNAAGCMTMLSVYPFTPFRGSWLYTSMASAPAGAQGIRDALDILLEQKRIQKKEDLDVVVLTGDGAAYGMGLSATSGAMERDLNFIYICYDNEGYGNTGQQYSGATPHAAKTATSKGPRGFAGYKKDLFSIWAAHKPAYLATIIGTEPLDLAQKIEKLKDIKGPRMLITLAPCPTGWEYDPRESIDIGRLAVKSGVWPLKEYIDGKVVHTKMPHPRIPVEEYLKKQGRFSHLFKPKRNKKLISQLQAKVDEYWDKIE